jgi:hypothetical protein
MEFGPAGCTGPAGLTGLTADPGVYVLSYTKVKGYPCVVAKFCKADWQAWRTYATDIVRDMRVLLDKGDPVLNIYGWYARLVGIEKMRKVDLSQSSGAVGDVALWDQVVETWSQFSPLLSLKRPTTPAAFK